MKEPLYYFLKISRTRLINVLVITLKPLQRRHMGVVTLFVTDSVTLVQQSGLTT